MLVQTINNPFRYAGYQYDQETGYYYLMSRYYDPVTARFITEDTYRGQKNDPLSLNLYTYCHNEPIMYSDPDGHKAKRKDGLYRNKDGSYTRTVNGNNYTVTKNDSRYKQISQEYMAKERNNVSGYPDITKDKQKDMVNNVSGKSTNDIRANNNANNGYSLREKVEKQGGTLEFNKNGSYISATVTYKDGRKEVYVVDDQKVKLVNGQIMVGFSNQGTGKNDSVINKVKDKINQYVEWEDKLGAENNLAIAQASLKAQGVDYNNPDYFKLLSLEVNKQKEINEEAWNVATGSINGIQKVGTTVKAIEGAGKTGIIEQHHLLPQQFKNQFQKAGLDIEKYKIPSDKADHRLKPDGLHTGANNWNKQWSNFFEQYPNATKPEILNQLDKMQKAAGLK